MVFQTEHSLYELRENEHLFRCVHHDPDGGFEGDEEWRPYAWVTPISPGEPVRIYLPHDEDQGRRITAVTTSPVQAILTAA
jgi:hypothetical protein